MRSSTICFTALTLFDTGTYTSFVNREVTKWLEQQDDEEPSTKTSRHDPLTVTVGLAGTLLSSNIYGTVVFDLAFFSKITKRGRLVGTHLRLEDHCYLYHCGHATGGSEGGALVHT